MKPAMGLLVSLGLFALAAYMAQQGMSWGSVAVATVLGGVLFVASATVLWRIVHVEKDPPDAC